jgi:hypothetical protein
VVLYINGEYNGLYDLNEDQNSEFLVTHYGVDGDTRTSSAEHRRDQGRKRRFQARARLCRKQEPQRRRVVRGVHQWVDVEFTSRTSHRETYSAIPTCSTKVLANDGLRGQVAPIFYDLDFAFKS